MSQPLFEQLANKGVYESTRFATPTSERLPKVLQAELTVGCSHNHCTFCDFYSGVDYKTKSWGEYVDHLNHLWTEVKRVRSPWNLGLERIFIEGGNALSVPTEELNQSIQATIVTFAAHTGRLPTRLSMYTNTLDILNKSVEELKQLHCGGICGVTPCSIMRFGDRKGLDLIYWGIETGNDSLLKEVNKGWGRKELDRAIERVRSTRTSHSKLRVSAFVIPGLGGEKFQDSHRYDTVRVLNDLEPDFVNFAGIEACPGTPYDRRMKK
ncbi:Radical SAM superfamily protein [uncultured archaeon]|nr:Radical SAM superfamily protein [uncultured archaeon]